jgi:hypothetical protein
VAAELLAEDIIIAPMDLFIIMTQTVAYGMGMEDMLIAMERIVIPKKEKRTSNDRM